MRVLIAALLFVSLALPWIGGTGLAMDEAILTPTSGKVAAGADLQLRVEVCSKW